MDENKINVGDTYQLESPLLSESFEGKILSKLEHSVIVEIVNCSKSDQTVAKDLQFKTVISYKDVKQKS